jgi:hypothetical protein
VCLDGGLQVQARATCVGYAAPHGVSGLLCMLAGADVICALLI